MTFKCIRFTLRVLSVRGGRRRGRWKMGGVTSSIAAKLAFFLLYPPTYKVVKDEAMQLLEWNRSPIGKMWSF